MVELSGLCDGEQPLRYARMKAFVHGPEIECHWHRSPSVRTGIEELAVHHDSDGNKARFPALRNLNQAQGAWALVGLPAPVLLCQPLRVQQRIPERKADHQRRCQRKDDGKQPYAI